MAYTDILTLVEGVTPAHQLLRRRLLCALAEAAHGVLAEPVATPGHAVRLRWARHALGDPPAASHRIHWAVYNHPALAAGTAATDAQLLLAVQAVLTPFGELYP